MHAPLLPDPKGPRLTRTVAGAEEDGQEIGSTWRVGRKSGGDRG